MYQEIDNEKAKQLLINYHTKQSGNPKCLLSSTIRKQSTLNKHLRILERDHFEAVLYSLKTLINKSEDKEVYVDLTSKTRPNNLVSEFNSSRQQVCHQCDGKKIKKCNTCKGMYSLNCNYCDSDSQQTCHHCYNSTFTFNDKCKTCHNKRLVVCDLCKGCGELICYKGKVTITEPIEDLIINCKDNSIPLMAICKGKGTVLVDQTKKKLEAINHYPDDVVHKNCKELLKRHDLKLQNSPHWELVSQNHRLVAIPIVSITAQCKDKKIKFMIIGENLEVYIPKSNRTPCSIS